ncbi:MAG: GH18 family chitinase/chitodextrinase [Alteromonadaceae bacterium]|jgi:GH18 family chitinase/chitodextrinase
MNNKKTLKAAIKRSVYSLMFMGGAVQAANIDCSMFEEWQQGGTYIAGQKVHTQKQGFESKWWNQTDPIQKSGLWQEWKKLGDCKADGDVNEAPTVSWISPDNNSAFTENDNVVILFSAQDSDGSIDHSDVFLDGNLLATLNTTTSELTWIALKGQHAFTVTAYDDKQASTSTSQLNLTVTAKDVPPDNKAPNAILTITTPANDVHIGDEVTFSLSATDSDGTVQGIELFAGEQSIFTSTNSNANFTWQALALGQVAFSLKATDDDAAIGVSNSVFVNVVKVGDPNDDRDACKPRGLYQTPETNTPYCTVYDVNGREEMGADHPRRVIGYFTSWRNGANEQPTYLVNNIPWDKITHINYAFAHIDSNNQVSIGDPNSANNPATNMTWPGVVGAELDPNLPYKGHFNLLSKYKKQYPHVKTLISIGGWAETGGYFDETGRVASGGFYTMTTNADGSINHAGIKAFSDSVVTFIKKYGFDGADIDYEYPSSMSDSGHPDDFDFSNPRRAALHTSYLALMKTLRETLDKAGDADEQHYMLTIASPSSGYLLRGMETFQATQYLDYVNIMSYDLHGAWNSHVGPNAALFDTGEDSELAAWDVYSTKEFEGIGYLNTDWAVRYFRGALSAGRINIGIPYYTRGFRDVSGGTNGLWGQAALPDQTSCPNGTGKGDKNNCGNGAVGIDNLWHDIENDNEVAAGSNPLWHVKNLADGKYGSYIGAYGLTPATDPQDRLTGTYQRHYDEVAVAPWLWNDEKKVFLSIEDEESMASKVDYVINNGLGGVMFWELAGDFDYDQAKQEYYMGSTMTTIAYDKFRQSGTHYDIHNGNPNFIVPEKVVDITFAAKDFPVGDENYPISPTFSFSNHSELDLSGAKISFDVPVSTSAIFKSHWSSQKKLKMAIEDNGSNSVGNNIGGFDNEYHRFSITLINEFGGVTESFKAGETVSAQVMYYMPFTGPANFTIEKGGKVYAFKVEFPELPEATKDDGDDDGDGKTCDGVVVADLPIYPNFPRKDWEGKPDHANAGDMMVHSEAVWKAKWWTKSEPGGADWENVCNL